MIGETPTKNKRRILSVFTCRMAPEQREEKVDSSCRSCGAPIVWMCFSLRRACRLREYWKTRRAVQFEIRRSLWRYMRERAWTKTHRTKLRNAIIPPSHMRSLDIFRALLSLRQPAASVSNCTLFSADHDFCKERTASATQAQMYEEASTPPFMYRMHDLKGDVEMLLLAKALSKLNC